MVMIEPEDNEEETIVENPLKSSSSKKTDTRDDKKQASTTASGPSGYASDGFETASEREISEDEDDDGGAKQVTSDNQPPSQQQQQQGQGQGQEKEHGQQVEGGDSFEDALNENELKQKALAHANDSKLEGNKLFGNSQYEEALSQYELALQVAPEMPASVELRSVCHANRAICFLKLGKYEDTIKECTKALELNPAYSKALLRRADAHEKLEHYEEAIADMKKLLELDPSNDQARRSIHRLEPIAAEKREKMKEEMLGKLKELGNSVLGRFGMSVDNFKAVKDPNTGSYSVSFQR